MIYLSQLNPTSPMDLSELIKLGPAFAALVFFVWYLMKKNDKLELALEKSEVSKEKMLIDTITSLNKASFALESNPAALKQHVKDAVKEEMGPLREEIEKWSTK